MADIEKVDHSETLPAIFFGTGIPWTLCWRTPTPSGRRIGTEIPPVRI